MTSLNLRASNPFFKHYGMKQKRERTKHFHDANGSNCTSLTVNLNMFENFPTAGTPSSFSNAMKICPGVS